MEALLAGSLVAPWPALCLAVAAGGHPQRQWEGPGALVVGLAGQSQGGQWEGAVLGLAAQSQEARSAAMPGSLFRACLLHAASQDFTLQGIEREDL